MLNMGVTGILRIEFGERKKSSSELLNIQSEQFDLPMDALIQKTGYSPIVTQQAAGIDMKNFS